MNVRIAQRWKHLSHVRQVLAFLGCRRRDPNKIVVLIDSRLKDPQDPCLKIRTVARATVRALSSAGPKPLIKEPVSS